MAYDVIATSVDDAIPLELYEFKLGIRAWRRTNVDTPINHSGQIFSPYTISASNLKSTGDASLAGIDVKVPGDDDIALMFVASPPSETVSLTIFSNHFDDSETRVIWKGRVLACSWDDEGYATLTCESIFASQQRASLRRRCNSNCEFALYDIYCGVSEALWQEVSTLTSVIGNQIVSPVALGKPDNYYAGGEVRWLMPFNVLESRTVRSSDSATGTLTLSSHPIGLITGMDLTLLPGCDHTYSGVNGCGKFNNRNRYGGAYRLPDANKSPFGGTSVY